MLPETPFLQLVPARAATALERIRQQVWQPAQPLPVEWAGASVDHVDLAAARKRPRKLIDKPFFWGKREDQAWFRITVPKACRDGAWFLDWREQGESTAYIGGVPWAGLDVAHLNCRIPADCKEIWMEVMALESGIWSRSGRPAMTPEGCRFEGAGARRRDDLAWEVSHDLHVLLDLLEDEYRANPSLRTPFGRRVGYNSPLEDVSVLYRQLARAVEEAVTAYERGGLAGARRKLREIYRALRGRAEALRCRLTGHAHIDLVWLWTEKAAESKAVHTFATANRLMEEYPEFRFGYSQPASYRAVERRAPKLMEAVRERIRQKRWEPVGAAEVESDTQIACGEALARSLLLGQDGFRDLQGKPSEVLWLPDVFGYSAALPQILSQTGVKYFFTTKLSWGAVSLFPHSSFIWQGPDGSEILAHVSQGLGYNSHLLPQEMRKAAREYRQADVHGETLVPCGFGDGGGGVTPEMCERARRLADLAGVPQSAWGRIDGFFAGLEEVRGRLPAYRGELYLQYHRGVLTTHGDLKGVFRAAERGLQVLEAAHCARAAGPIDVEAWRRVVFAQFHDYIPGSSVPEVYREALPELEGIAAHSLQQAARGLAGKKGKECLFNPLPVPRRVVRGNRVLHLDALCGAPVDALPEVEAGPVRATRGSIDNGRVRARFDRQGRIRSLSVDGQPVAVGAPLAQLMLYPDQPHAYDAWEVDRSTLASGHPAPAAKLVRSVGGPAEGRLTFECALTESSGVRIRYRLEAASPVLLIEYEIDWNDPATLLKVCFPTAYSGAHARFGGPFGSSLRSQQPGETYDEAQWEAVGSRWALVADDGEQEGLFVVTESKYGWTCRSGNLGLSLLRSAAMPNPEHGSVEVQRGRPTHFSDLGRQVVRIAVGRFDSQTPREELPATLADTLFTPALPYQGGPVDVGLLGIDGGESLVPCWAKPEENGTWTLRLHETLGRRGNARVRLSEGRRLERVDLSGKTWPRQPRNGSVEFSPYQVVSLRVAPA